MRRSGARKFGTLRADLSPTKDRIDFWLSRFPGLYLAVEEHREWVNWDKRVYLSFISEGDVVIDVGANVGAHTVFFSNLVRKGGQVLAFEPLPQNLDSLRALLERRARYDNVLIVESAVGNPAAGVDRVTIRIPGLDLTQAALVAHDAGSWSTGTEVHSIECSITSLDRDESVARLAKISFLKIDVEGAELDVLRGGAATISRHRPLIYCEMYRKWSRTFGYGPADLMEFAGELGYPEARVIVDGQVRAHATGDKIPENWFTNSSDILFFREEHGPLLTRFDDRYLAGSIRPPGRRSSSAGVSE